MAIVADFESYPLWNDEIKGCWVLARYEDGRPSQLRLDVVVQGQAGTFITAVYYPAENQIHTVLQQGEFFEKQEQKFSVVPIGATSLLTVDLDVETKLPIPKPMVKKAIGDTLDYLADNLKARAEELPPARSVLTAQPAQRVSSTTPISSSRAISRVRAVGELAAGEPHHGVDIAPAQRRDQLAVAGHRGGTPLPHRRHRSAPAGTARHVTGTRPA